MTHRHRKITSTSAMPQGALLCRQLPKALQVQLVPMGCQVAAHAVARRGNASPRYPPSQTRHCEWPKQTQCAKPRDCLESTFSAKEARLLRPLATAATGWPNCTRSEANLSAVGISNVAAAGPFVEDNVANHQAGNKSCTWVRFAVDRIVSCIFLHSTIPLHLHAPTCLRSASYVVYSWFQHKGTYTLFNIRAQILPSAEWGLGMARSPFCDCVLYMWYSNPNPAKPPGGLSFSWSLRRVISKLEWQHGATWKSHHRQEIAMLSLQIYIIGIHQNPFKLRETLNIIATKIGIFGTWIGRHVSVLSVSLTQHFHWPSTPFNSCAMFSNYTLAHMQMRWRRGAQLQDLT